MKISRLIIGMLVTASVFIITGLNSYSPYNFTNHEVESLVLLALLGGEITGYIIGTCRK